MNGFLTRWVLAFLLLTATYNPTPWNYFSWTFREGNLYSETAIAVFVGLLLLAAYVIYIRATLRSIGRIGMGLVTAIVAALIWVMVDQQWLSLETVAIKTWIALIGLSFVLGIGLSWSHVRRVISGQSDMDDVSE